VPIHTLGTGVFVTEIDEAVMDGRADVAVHSAKDLPSTTRPGMVIGAYLPRADARDCLVGLALSELKAGARVASGSVRRRAQLAWLRPDLTFEDLRGNVPTRLDKVPPGGAVVVAMAALQRLGLEERAAQVFSTTEMLPQVGQGAVALTCRADAADVFAALAAVDERATRLRVEAERSFLRTVGGGCELPVGAHCVVIGQGLRLAGMIASLDGHVVVRASLTGSQPEDIGAALAAQLLDRGGRALLEGMAAGLAAR
jgi:hydroxymethylbilane synthase